MKHTQRTLTYKARRKAKSSNNYSFPSERKAMEQEADLEVFKRWGLPILIVAFALFLGPFILSTDTQGMSMKERAEFLVEYTNFFLIAMPLSLVISMVFAVIRAFKRFRQS